jgi:hypothetical protein
LLGWQMARQIGDSRRQIGRERAICERRKSLAGHRFGFASFGAKQ